MGLDIYVGPLTRYYLGDWKLSTQGWAESIGIPFSVLRGSEGPEEKADPQVVRRSVSAWKEAVTRALKKHVRKPIEWDESDQAPYFTQKPGWDGFESLRLWAAYEEHPKIVRPSQRVESADVDPAIQESQEEGFWTRYPQIVQEIEIWIPCDFDFVFGFEDVFGDDIKVGSSVALLNELKLLNERSWKFDLGVNEGRLEVPMEGDPLEQDARQGFAIMVPLCVSSVEQRLPIKLDY